MGAMLPPPSTRSSTQAAYDTDTQLSCNDDTTGCGTVGDGTKSHRGSRLTPTVTAGQTYFIVVDGYSGQSGNFSLIITPP